MTALRSDVIEPTTVMPDALKKAGAGKYEAPKIVTYALDGVKPFEQMASTGNG